MAATPQVDDTVLSDSGVGTDASAAENVSASAVEGAHASMTATRTALARGNAGAATSTGDGLFCPDAEYFKKPHHTGYSSGDSYSDGYVTIALDVETTGPNTHAGPSGRRVKSAMVEIGAVAVSHGAHPVVLGVFEGFMGVPDGCDWDPTTVREFWNRDESMREKKKLAEACTVEPGVVMNEFVDFVNNVVAKYAGGKPTRVLFISDNPGYDAKWLDLYLAEYTEHPDTSRLFGCYSPVLDTDSYAMAAAKHDVGDRMDANLCDGWYSADSSARTALRIDASLKPTAVHDHRAAHDALYIAQMHAIIINATTK